jgi:hypothetical protein
MKVTTKTPICFSLSPHKICVTTCGPIEDVIFWKGRESEQPGTCGTNLDAWIRKGQCGFEKGILPADCKPRLEP